MKRIKSIAIFVRIISQSLAKGETSWPKYHSISHFVEDKFLAKHFEVDGRSLLQELQGFVHPGDLDLYVLILWSCLKGYVLVPMDQTAWDALRIILLCRYAYFAGFLDPMPPMALKMV